MACSWPACHSRSCCLVASGAGMGCCRERGRPRPSKAEVRPGVLRHFCGWFPLQILCKGLIELSCVSSFCSHGSVPKEHGQSTAALRGLLGAQQPRCQACTFDAQGGHGSAGLSYGAGALSNTGLRGGSMQVLM